MTVATRECRKCGKVKPVTEFWKRSKGDGLRRQCKSCHHAYRSTPEFTKRRQSWARQKKYGLSEEGYQELFDRQGGRCGICQLKLELVVDHDHTTKEVRGLLCSSCNLILGHCGEDIRVLKRAIRYLLHD